MPTTPTYPGVYVEEIPSGVRAITGVATSVAAFVDQFRRGPVNTAVQVLSFADFEREFGGLDRDSEASYAIQQFFLNGGNEAWVVRVARTSTDGETSDTAVNATVTIGADGSSARPALEIEAVNPGDWGNGLRVGVEPVDGNGTFNLVVSQFGAANDSGAPIRQAIHRNLTMDSGKPDFVNTVVNDPQYGSTLIRAEKTTNNGGSAAKPPLANGTSSGQFTTESVTVPARAAVAVTVSTSETEDVPATARLSFHNSPDSQDRTLIDVAAAIEAGIRAAKPDHPAFAGATVRVAGKKGQRLFWVMPGGNEADTKIQFKDVPGELTAGDLKLTSDAVEQAATLSDPLEGSLTFSASPNKLKVKIGNMEKDIELTIPDEPTPSSLAPALQTAIRGAPSRANDAFTSASVSAAGNRLIVLPGTGNDHVTFTNFSASDTTADALGLTGDARRRTATISGELAARPTLPPATRVKITIGDKTKTILLPLPASTTPRPVALADIAAALHTAMVDTHRDAAFADAIVTVINKRLVILAGDNQVVRFADAALADTTATGLKLKDATVNIAEYQLGGGAVADSAQLAGTSGADGGRPQAQDLIGSPAAKTGIYALEDVDLFNILCIPCATHPDVEDTERTAVLSAAIQYCERRRAFFLVDTPDDVNDPSAIKSWLAANDTLRHRNAALYYPRVKVPDPLDGFRLRSLGASGSVAGVFARTDAARGVWKAPAGTEATLRNVTALDDLLTDGENGTLNPLAINCLRTFPIFGNVVWGARTLDGADQEASEWKYVPVRRLSLFLEESLYRGTKWVVFEPNGDPLWAQIRLNLGGFMHTLYRQGAFQGTTPRDAYFVKCDKETTTQNDIDLGIVNIVVGFAPLKPAEFVIVKFQQMAGQIAT